MLFKISNKKQSQQGAARRNGFDTVNIFDTYGQPSYAESDRIKYRNRRAARLTARRYPPCECLSAARFTPLAGGAEAFQKHQTESMLKKILRLSPKKHRIIAAVLGAAGIFVLAAVLIYFTPGFLSGGTLMPVTRITVIDGKETRLVFTRAKTAGEVMKILGIEPDSDDYINLSADTPVTPDMVLEYHSIEYKDYVIDEVLHHDVVAKELQTIPRGEVLVMRDGIDGSLYREVRAEYRSGELYDEQILKESYIAPTDKLITIGIGGTLTGANGSTYNFSHYLDVSATAYAAGGITYTGKQAQNGIVAVDPEVIPLGTALYVKGDYGDYGVCTADDIGAGITGNRIDICIEDDISVLFEFGIRPMRVYILEQ